MNQETSQKPFRIAVLASTNGTDLQAIIDEIKTGKMPGIELSIVVSNKSDSFALKRAADQGFETKFISPKGKTRIEYDAEVAQVLKEKCIDLICLIGYMRILSPEFVREFAQKIINVHPALMPKFSGPGYFGSNVHEEVLKAGEKESGCTIHYVDEGVDTGKIIIQAKVPIVEGETVESLKQKVQSQEKFWYPEIIRRVAKGEI